MRQKIHREFTKIGVAKNMKDLTGKRFGMLTAEYPQRYTNPSGRKFIYWHCRCDCGKETDVVSTSLLNGVTKSCGCMQNEWNKQTHTKDLPKDTRREKLVFTGEEKEENGVSMILCHCDCGNEKWVRRHDFLEGSVLSCGCQAKETRKNKMHLEGQTFGYLKVLKRDPDSENWICQCTNCGKICTATPEQLKKGKKTSCGCKQYDYMAQYASEKKQKKKESVLGKTFMTTSGVSATVIAYDGNDKCVIRFEDGTIKRPGWIGKLEKITHPALNSLPKQYDENGNPLQFCGFNIIRGPHGSQFRLDDGTPVYHAKCSVCGMENLLSPQQMIEHAKKHGWKAEEEKQEKNGQRI